MRPIRCCGRTWCALLGLTTVACVPPHTVSRALDINRSCPEAGPQRGPESLTWYFPEQAPDNRDLESWCETVGPPVIELVPDRASSMPPGPDSLRLAIWNTNAGAGDLLAFVTQELGLDCGTTRATRGETDSPPHFVLLLQEAFRRSDEIPILDPTRWVPPASAEKERQTARLDVVSVARTCGLSLLYVPAARNGAEARDDVREDKGNAVLSTLPLSNVTAIELPFENARRVVVSATVRGASNRNLRVASIYLLTMATPWRILTTGNGSRLREALALIDALEKIERREARERRVDAGPERTVSTLGGGDLNTWSTRETALQHLREYFRDSPAALSEPTRGAFPTDHLLLRAGDPGAGEPDAIEAGSYRRVERTFNSDHHPIVAWLRFGRPDDAGVETPTP